MKRLKYQPRVGENRGENKIKEEWLKEQFGEQFKLIWNGHSHFALDKNTGEMYYIFKTLNIRLKTKRRATMTKTFCDICGKELSALEQMNSYNVAITSKNRTLRTPWVRVCPEICKDCTEKIVDFINLLKENKND